MSERKSLGYHEGKIYILLSWPSNVWKSEKQNTKLGNTLGPN